jgi:hypothetical protein
MPTEEDDNKHKKAIADKMDCESDEITRCVPLQEDLRT